MKRILFPITILMAILIVIVSVTTVSFSWFMPDSASGIGLQFSETTTVRSADCSLTTYSGNDDDLDGVITYGQPVSSSVTVASTTKDGEVVSGIAYFKTVIQNNNAKYNTNVSLYIPTFNVNSSSKVYLGVSVPTNTYRAITGNNTNLHIIRNAFISAYSSNVTGAGSITVEWFVKCDSGTVTFDPSTVFLMYN